MVIFNVFILVASCPRLPPIQNGWLLPKNCNNGYTYEGEECKIYCKQGFKLTLDDDHISCNGNLDWIPLDTIDRFDSVCIRGIY